MGGPRHVEVAAQDDRLAERPQAGGVGGHRFEKTHLGREVLAAVGDVDRRHRHAVRPWWRRCASRGRTPGARRAAGRARPPGARAAPRPSTPWSRASSTSSRGARRPVLGMWSAAALISCRQRTSGCSRSTNVDDLILPRADSVDVPGGDLHRSMAYALLARWPPPPTRPPRPAACGWTVAARAHRRDRRRDLRDRVRVAEDAGLPPVQPVAQERLHMSALQVQAFWVVLSPALVRETVRRVRLRRLPAARNPPARLPSGRHSDCRSLLVGLPCRSARLRAVPGR